MPAPPKTSDAQIIEAARSLLERKGRDGFSLSDVAAAVGVRAPSLYRRFEDRAAILEAVELASWRELATALAQAIVPRQPLETLHCQARAYRAFAKAHPNAYSLMFEAPSRRTEEGARARADALAPAMPALTALAGPDNAPNAARVLTPFLHGFASMEIGDAFRLGGGLDTAFEQGVATILHGLAKSRGRSSRRGAHGRR